MKAVLVNKDQSLSWSDVPDPEMKADEVLVEIHYAALAGQKTEIDLKNIYVRNVRIFIN